MSYGKLNPTFKSLLIIANCHNHYIQSSLPLRNPLLIHLGFCLRFIVLFKEHSPFLLHAKEHVAAHARKGIMGVLEKISENLDLAEAKKNSLRKSIFTLMGDWEEFEKHSELTQKRFHECFLELESREKNLNSVQESVRQSCQDLKSMRELVEKRVREVEDREKGLVLLQEKGKMELALKEKEWECSREKLIEEFREKERKLNEKEILLNGLYESLEIEKNELAELEKLVEKRLREVGLQEECIEDRRKEIELIQDWILKRVNELDDREGKVKEWEKMVGFKGLDTLRVDRERAIDMKEKEVSLIREDLELKEKEIDFLLALNDKRMREWDMTEKQLKVKKKELEITHECMKEIQLKKMKYLEEKELLERRNKELELKKKELEDSIEGLKELDVSKKQLEAKRKRFEIAEKSLGECQFKKKQCQSEKELLEDRVKELEVKRKELEGRIEGIKELKVREKQLEAKRKELEEVERESLKECQLKKKQCQSEKELLEKRNEELVLKKKEFENRIKAFEIREKEFEVKEKKLNDKLHAQEPVKKVVGESLNSNSFCSKFTLGVELDGLDVHMSLNGLKIDLSSKDEVLKALRLSQAPVFLVLNAIETLYPPYLRKVDMAFEGNVARSCLILLEQLIRVSPNIQSNERDKALKLAREWKAMTTKGNSLEVLGFLYLLAAFNLASAFDTEEVMTFLGIVAEHHQMPELCRHLGLGDKIPGVIRNLLKGNKHSLQAIGLIYAFELVDQFPPVPILKNYLKHVRRVMKAMAKSSGAKNDAIDKRIAAMKAVIRCILDHKLESQYSPKILEASIQQLLMQKVHEKCSESVIRCKAQDQKEVEDKEFPSTSGSDANLDAQDQREVEESIPSTISPICFKGCKIATQLSNTNIAPPDAMALILANMNGKSLLSFLTSDSVDHSFLQNEVCTALQISDDSAKLVLDVLDIFYSSYPWEQGSRSCIFLLEQLMKISPLIVVDVKKNAQKIAFDWKARMSAEFENPSVILVFLLFISIFRLVSAFDKDELLQLYKIVAKHKSVAGLCQSLGISEMISESQQVRAEDLQLEIKSATSTMVLANDVKSLCNVDLESEEQVLYCSQIPRFIQNSSDPAKLVLDSLEFSYFSNCPKNKISPLVVKSVFYLLKQLMSVSPKITPSVKDTAFKLAHDWKSKLTGTNSWEVLAFLQLLAVYGLSSSFSAKYLLGLLEVPSQLLKEASNLIRILGLEYKVPGFIMDLVKRKQRLLAFEYVYEFNLVDKLPPVALLKKHVLHSKLAAKEICKDGQTTLETRDRAIADEISALKNVIKCILAHNLQSEYSPVELTERIAHLETQRANLKISMPANILENFPRLDKNEQQCTAQKAKLQREDTRKRPASDNAITKESQLPPSKMFRCLTSPAEAAPNFELPNGHSSHSMQQSSFHQDGLRTERHVTRMPNNDSLGGSNPTMQQANRLALQFGSHVGSVNMVSSSFPFYQFGLAFDLPYRLAGYQFFP